MSKLKYCLAKPTVEDVVKLYQKLTGKQMSQEGLQRLGGHPGEEGSR